MLNAEEINAATRKFAEDAEWVPPSPPAENVSEKAMAISKLLMKQDWGCRGNAIRELVSLVIDEEVPSPNPTVQEYKNFDSTSESIPINTMFTVTTLMGGMNIDETVLADKTTSRSYERELLRALTKNGGRSGYLDISYLRPATEEEINDFVATHNASEEAETDALSG